jgi:glucokinase
MVMSKKKAEYVVGVDLGGTKILSAVIDSRYRILSRAKKNTRPERGVDVVVDRVAASIEEALDELELTYADIKAIGIGAPGMCDPKTGTVLFAPNLAWRNEPLGPMLSKYFGVPVFVENDVNVCTLGVYHLELLKSKPVPRSVVGIFVGTGIGAGIIINGELFRGHNFTAGEIGHMALSAEDGPKCGCGNRGCLEAFAGRLGLVKRISSEMKNEKGDTPLHRLLAEEKDHKIKSKHIAEALRERDPIVTKAVNDVAEYLGMAIINVMHLLNPDAVVLGGGVMQSFGDYVMPRVQKAVKRRGIPVCCDGVQLVGTRLGDDAGILGASVVAWTSLAAKTKRS